MHDEYPGLFQSTKVLANGNRRTYYYAWRGGPPLIGDPGTQEFSDSYDAAHAARRKGPEDKLMSVIIGYKGSLDFERVSPRTRSDYFRCIKEIEIRFGSMPLAALKAPKCNAVFLDWRDRLTCGDKWADYHWTVLSVILNWGCNRGLIEWNRPTRVTKRYSADRSENIWMPSDVEAMTRASSPELVWALTLAAETGQRQGDLLRMSWSQINDGWIKLSQSKTRARVEVPVTEHLSSVLATIPRRAITVLTTQSGRSWTQDGFRASWSKAFAKAGLGDLHFNDLRGTAVVQLAEAGCTIPEIASITGHSLKSVSSILERYWTRTRMQARAAITKLEEHRKIRSGT